MEIKTINYDNIDEIMYLYEHSSGLKAFVIPKKGYSKKFAAFGTHYGSINNEFVVDGERTKVPDGIAHFLEHKLFEQEDESVMDKFSKLGSSPNAYTSFSQTVYLFSCTDKFFENFNLLLDYVQNPYITEESVEKEKEIIGQEIRMYDDNPNWRVFFNFLDALYEKNTVKIDIAGSVESISKIDREVLYKCYNTFYHPSNMVIVVVGDVDPKQVFEKVEKNIKESKENIEIERIFPDEPAGINKPYVEEKLAVSMPLFQMGFKDFGFNTKGIECLNREIAVKILLEMILGKSSELYTTLYNDGLINNTFNFDYSIEESYAFSSFGGESKDPIAVKERVTTHIKVLQEKGIDKKDYQRIKRAMRGKFIKQLNSVERVAHSFMSVYFKEVSIFDYLDVYDKISFEYVKKVFEGHFDIERLAVSVIKPVS
ncbi:EF-P 5-aminopentanol modification-associated protein YfmH [Herbivorax sp. ANBcel31]|uniref:EF-P 5-aminopentanol modification-associated protein YfmH n=1 Tax=Herbivorax sp. ANBcel31 TaxID=3069754 RepID=UPI0035944BBD